LTIRISEITTLISRKTITVEEKTKLTKEQEEAKDKLETQKNVIETETKNLSTLETSITTITTTITTFKKYITEITVVIKELEKKVVETKKVLKTSKKVTKEEKKEEKEEKKDEDGDDEVDDVDDKDDEDEPDAVKGKDEKVDKELDQTEEENKSVTTQIDSLTKTITTTQEKQEVTDKETVLEITDTTKEESEITTIRIRKKRLIRRRERQRCSRLFPAVFSSFKIKRELTAENMCPCPGGGKGLTQLILDGIEDPGDFDKYVLHLFEKNLAIEGTFQAQMQRYFFNDGDKLVSEETNPVSLRLVMGDDKVDEVMNALDAQNLALKSTDFKISPLLKGKTDYIAWQSSSVSSTKAPSVHVSLGGGDDDDEDDEDDFDE